MNETRLKALSAALRTETAAKMFHMASWVQEGERALPEAFAAGGGCGTTGCILGMAAAIDPISLTAFFGDHRNYGTVALKANPRVSGAEAFSRWLDIDFYDATELCGVGGGVWERWGDLGSVPASLAADVLDAYAQGGIAAAREVANYGAGGAL